MKFFRKSAVAAGGGYVAQRPAVQRRGVSLWVIAVCALLMLGIAGLVGAVAGLGSIPLIMLLAGPLFIGPLVFIVSTRQMLPLMFIFVFLIQGTVSNYFHLRITTWMASGIGFLFLLRAFFELSAGRSFQGAPRTVSGGSAGVMACCALYLACFFFSLALGSGTPAQIISAVRFGVPMWGVLFALYWFEWSEKEIERLFLILVIGAMLQLPLVAYQHFFEINMAGAWDAVVGTFGNGMSAILTIFCLTAAFYALARWRRGILAGWITAAVCTVTLAIIILGEVKAVAFWVPLGLFIIFRRKILSSATTFMLYGTFIVVFVVGVFTAYQALYWGDQVKATTVEEGIDQSGGYFFDTQAIDYRTGEVSRAASLALWINDPVPGALERLVGYGPGASSTGANTGKGVVAARYGILSVNSTVIAQLLWDVGVVGTIAYCTIFVFGCFTALRYVKRGGSSPGAEAVVDTSLAALAMLATTLIYNRALLDEPTVQLLFLFCLGCVVQYARYHNPHARLARARGHAAPRAVAPLHAVRGPVH